MQQNWQTRLTRSRENAFRVAALSPPVTERIFCLLLQAITEGMPSEKFHYMAEKEMNND